MIADLVDCLFIYISVGMMIPEWREGLSPRDTKKHELILGINMESHTINMDKLMLK